MDPVMVFGPSPILTVTIERRGGDEDDVHLHAGGQGFWIARMLAALDVPVTLCGCFGGETGAVVRVLIEQAGIDVRAVQVESENVAAVFDRRSGAGPPLAAMTEPALSRHDVDALYGLALAHGLEGSVSVLGGTPGQVIPAETYERLTRDLRTNGRTVVADLSGDQLRAALAGGVDVLKVSDEELVQGGWSPTEDVADLLATIRGFDALGVGTVVVSRAAEPALARIGQEVVEVSTPRLTPTESRGAGDSMTGGIAAGMARRYPIGEAVRLGAAAGAMNVTRRGLASGDRTAIELLAKHIELRPSAATAAPRHDETSPVVTTTPDELAARARPG